MMNTKSLIYVVAMILLVGLSTCNKAEDFEDDVFMVTYLRPSDGCPAGPLIQFQQKDVPRFKHFLAAGHADNYTGNGSPVSAINLNSIYDSGQSLAIKIRQPIGEEHPFCTANLMWYSSIYVLEVVKK